MLPTNVDAAADCASLRSFSLRRFAIHCFAARCTVLAARACHFAAIAASFSPFSISHLTCFRSGRCAS